ncbi:hypothetical protein AB0G74_24050 [Streptomyces sp. NPDC020875]|uniref:hypothetical protein n=1 Tax=Streptomyces sp. NPDC020875 TaxID=3154898 RepID=UPI00340CD707
MRDAPKFRVEITAEGPVYGTLHTARVTLGTFETPYPGRALRWTSVQAHRIADRLDPAPDTPWATGSLRHLPAYAYDTGDAPTQLRHWATPELIGTAHHRLRDGYPVILTATDHTGRYTATITPPPHRNAPTQPTGATPR